MTWFIRRVKREEKARIADCIFERLSVHYEVPKPQWKFADNAGYDHKAGVIYLTETEEKAIAFIQEEVLHEYFHYLEHKLLKESKMDFVVLEEKILIDNVVYLPLYESFESAAETFARIWYSFLEKEGVVKW